MTAWTEKDYQELSRKVAEKFGVTAHDGVIDGTSFLTQDDTESWESLWLHNDWHTIMELCVKHGVFTMNYTNHTKDDCIAYFTRTRNDKERLVVLADHANDPSLAERVARMMALLEVAL